MSVVSLTKANILSSKIWTLHNFLIINIFLFLLNKRKMKINDIITFNGALLVTLHIIVVRACIVTIMPCKSNISPANSLFFFFKKIISLMVLQSRIANNSYPSEIESLARQ